MLWKHTELHADSLVPLRPGWPLACGAEIRYLVEGETGSMIHSTVSPGQLNRATMPRWPGDAEATVIEGPWKPTAPEG